MNIRVAALALLALVWLVLAGQAEAADPTVELRLWNIPSKTSVRPVDVARRRVFDAFRMQHPQIRVRALVPLKIQGPAQEGNEFLAVAGGVAPDVFYLYGRKIGDYRSQGFLLPLNDYLKRYKTQHGRPYEGIIAPDKVWELCQNNGNIECLPYLYYSLTLQCDNPAFAKAGLAGKAPKNWDELYWFARRLSYDPTREPAGKPDEPVQYGLSMLTGIIAGWHYLQYVWSAGGEVVRPYYLKNGKLNLVTVPPVDYRSLLVKLSNEDQYYTRLAKDRQDLISRGLPTQYGMEELEWRLETNSEKAIRAFYFYRKLVHQPWLRNRGHEFDITPEMFKAGKAVDPETGDTFDLDDPKVQKRIYRGVTAAASQQSGTLKLERVRYAMSIGTLEEVNDSEPGRLTLVPFPPIAGEAPSAFIAGHYVAINRAIVPEDRPGRRDVDAVRDAAWKYLEFVTGPDAQKITIRTFAEFGLAEFVRPALLKEAGYEDLLARIPQERKQLWDNLAKHARVEPYAKGFTHVMTRELGMAIEAIVNDPPDPKTGEFRVSPQAVMDATVKNVNTMILGKMPEAEVKRRARIGWVIFVVMAVALAVGARQVVVMALRSQAKVADNEGFGVGGDPSRRRLYAWVFLTPAVATIAIWAYYPLLQGMLMAFQDFKILGGSDYVGLRNFVAAVSEPKFWRYLLQTFEYMALLVGIGFLIPIFLAIFLTEIPKGKVLYRTIYYLPAVTSGLVTLFLWKGLMYDPSNQGVINSLLVWFNAWPVWLVAIARLAVLTGSVALAVSMFAQMLQAVNTRNERVFAGLIGTLIAAVVVYYLGSMVIEAGLAGLFTGIASKFDFQMQTYLLDPKLAMLWVVVPVIWAGAGPGCLIYLAALKGIPEEQYEAADLDGAGLWHKVMNVIYPNLKALIIINLVGAVIGGFKESGNIFVMTGGGPEDATMTTGLYIWYNAFMFLNFGLATSMAWIMGALLIGFTLKQLQILNKLQFRSTAVEDETKGGK